MADTPPKRPGTVIPVPNKPQRNVPAVVIEDPTPVDMPPMAILERRSQQTKQTSDQTLSAVTQMRSELKQYVELDAREHEHLRAGLRDIGTKYDKIDEKVDELATSSAHMHGKLDILLEDIKAQKLITIHREKVTIEKEATQEKIRLEDQADEKKFRRQKWLKLIGIVAALATAVAGGISVLFGKC